jgi:drug/metabolite transporter (DMT)-like permease
MVGNSKGGGFSAMAIGCIRWCSLAVLMQALLSFSDRFRRLTGFVKPDKNDWRRGFLLGFFLFAPAHMLFYESLSFTSEVEGTVILSTAPLFTGVFGFLVLKEHLTTYRMLAIGLSIVGAYIVSVGFNVPNMQGNAKGNLLFGLGVVVECLMGVWAAKLSRRSSGVGVLSSLIWGAAAAFLFASLMWGGKFVVEPSASFYLGIASIGYLICVSGLITFTIWYKIVEDAPLTLLVVGIALQPPVAALIDWFAREKLPTAQTVIGGLIILAALALGFGVKTKEDVQELEEIHAH